MEKLAMFISSRARPGKRDELYALYREHLAPRAEANPAQETVVWCADNDDEDAFMLFEVYNDPAAPGENAGADWFAEYMAAAAQLMAGEPKVAMATPRWWKGL